MELWWTVGERSVEGRWKVNVVEPDNSTNQPTNERVWFCLYLPHMFFFNIFVIYSGWIWNVELLLFQGGLGRGLALCRGLRCCGLRSRLHLYLHLHSRFAQGNLHTLGTVLAALCHPNRLRGLLLPLASSTGSFPTSTVTSYSLPTSSNPDSDPLSVPAAASSPPDFLAFSESSTSLSSWALVT